MNRPERKNRLPAKIPPLVYGCDDVVSMLVCDCVRMGVSVFSVHLLTARVGQRDSSIMSSLRSLEAVNVVQVCLDFFVNPGREMPTSC